MPCPVHQVKESPNLKINSELVDSIGVGHKGQKARRSLSFYQINNKKKVFCEFLQFRSRNLQITKKVQNWLTQMEDIKARRSPFRKIKCNNGRQLGILKKLRTFREHTTSTKFSNLKFLLALIFFYFYYVDLNLNFFKEVMKRMNW